MNEDLKKSNNEQLVITPAENVGSFSYENNTYASNPELQRLGEIARRQAEPIKPEQTIDSLSVDYIESPDKQLEDKTRTPEEVIAWASQGVVNLRSGYEADYAKYLEGFGLAA